MTEFTGCKNIVKAAFLDRDGVINLDKGYVSKIADFEFAAGAVDAMLALQAAGYLIVIVTNQSGIARGFFLSEEFEVLMAYVEQSLDRSGVKISGVFHCPHLPGAPIPMWDVNCDCRKPMPGLILRAARDLGIDLKSSIIVGDKNSDVIAGRRAGVRKCYRISAAHQVDEDADGTYADLLHCVESLAAENPLFAK
jgi:D-glycero-D-manno-heptose 1,7-bisphosphate phosphatase